MKVWSIGGATCAGKGTFLDYAKAQLGDKVYLVQIGKIMRTRHPPEFFNGLGAMASTEAEVWEILGEELNKALADPNVRMVLLDGLPRMGGQIPKLLSYFNTFIRYGFVFLHASQETRKERVKKRFPYSAAAEEAMRNQIPLVGPLVEEVHTVKSNRDLADRRVVNDLVQIHDVLAEVTIAGFPINYISTEGPPESYCRHLLEQLWGGPIPKRYEDPLLGDKSVFDLVSKAWQPSSLPQNHDATPIDQTCRVIEQPHRDMGTGPLQP